MSVGHGGNDIVRTEGCVAAEEDSFMGGLKGKLVEDRKLPLIELDDEVMFDPGETVLLTDSALDIITGQDYGIFTGGD